MFAQTIPLPDLGTGGLAGLITFFLAAWLNEWIVSGKENKRQREEFAARLAEERARTDKDADNARREIEYWRDIALTTVGLTEKAVQLAERRS